MIFYSSIVIGVLDAAPAIDAFTMECPGSKSAYGPDSLRASCLASQSDPLDSPVGPTQANLDKRLSQWSQSQLQTLLSRNLCAQWRREFSQRLDVNQRRFGSAEALSFHRLIDEIILR